MAKFTLELPFAIIDDVEFLNKNAEKIFGDGTKAGAEVVMSEIRSRLPDPRFADKLKITRVYRTPSDDGINTKVYLSGYLPFSDPNRKYFARRGKQGGQVYKTTKGVPVEFLANLYEYGRSENPWPKKPFLRKAFGQKTKIEKAMKAEIKKASGGLIDDD